MPISVRGNDWPPAAGGMTHARRSAEHGFTLIELMVVVAIIGLAAGAAVLAMPDPRGRVRDEAARFALRARAARDGAIIDARPTSVWITPAGYGFDAWQGGRWVAMDEKPLRVAQWGKGTTATIGGDRLRVTFDATGAADRPLTVPLLRERARATVIIDTTGAIRIDG